MAEECGEFIGPSAEKPAIRRLDLVLNLKATIPGPGLVLKIVALAL